MVRGADGGVLRQISDHVIILYFYNKKKTTQ